MKIKQKQDVEDLLQSLDFALQNVKVDSQSLIGEQIGMFLIKKSQEIIVKGALDESHYYFSTPEIFESLNGEKDSEKARRWIKSHENNLVMFFEQTSPMNIELANRNLSTLYIERVSSRGGRPTQWRLGTGSKPSYNSNRPDSQNIRYIVTELHDPLPWAKPFMNTTLSPVKLALIASVLLTTPIIAIFTLTGVIDWKSKLTGTIFVLLSLVAMLFFFGLKELLSKGVTAFPMFWTKKLGQNKLFLTRSTGLKETPLGMKAVSIEANCSICGESILIETSREFNGRYVGKCRIAPAEHIFSFDHVTKEGKFLR